MTRPAADGGGLARAFPAPGARLGTAYRDLFLAAEGTDNQKAVIGDPSRLPRPWDPPTLQSPALRAELWAWLEDVVDWVNHEYLWDPQPMISPCWPLHPHLVHEIAVLADQRRRAGIALDSNLLEEWHRYSLPGFLDRMNTRLKAHCDQDHQPWPARGRYTRHTDEIRRHWQQEAFNDDIRQLQPAEPFVPARPRLTLLETDTDSTTER